MDNPYSICVTVPPLSGIVLKPELLPQPESVAASAEEEIAPEEAVAVAEVVPAATTPVAAKDTPDPVIAEEESKPAAA